MYVEINKIQQLLITITKRNRFLSFGLKLPHSYKLVFKASNNKFVIGGKSNTVHI